MRRISVLPIGMVLLLKSPAGLNLLQAIFQTRKITKFREANLDASTTSKRLLAISEAIRSNADEFSRGQETQPLEVAYPSGRQ